MFESIYKSPTFSRIKVLDGQRIGPLVINASNQVRQTQPVVINLFIKKKNNLLYGTCHVP